MLVGVRFTLNNPNRFQHNQPRYRPPTSRPNMSQPATAWRPLGVSAPPPPLSPSNQNTAHAYVLFILAACGCNTAPTFSLILLLMLLMNCLRCLLHFLVGSGFREPGALSPGGHWFLLV